MAYLALARKWRPQQFSDVVGQKHITQTLINAIKQGRLSHAYLFTGPRGIGKTTIARILAKSVNCLSFASPTPQPCDRCDSCREIATGISLDVLEIDGASNRGIEEIRQLRENVKFAPASARCKIYIVDEVHMLTPEAFNALLKTLEEPPAHVKFFFATTNPHKLPATIVSRCQRFDLRKIPRELIRERLEKILEEEKVAFEEEALRALSSCADGSMRDAESILDQLLVYCDNKIRLQDVFDLLGLVPRKILNEFSRAIAAGDVTGISGLVEEVFKQGWDVTQFLSALVGHFRDLLLVTVEGRGADLIMCSEEELGALVERARQFTRPQLLFILDELIQLERDIRFSLSERIALEVALIRLARSPERIYLDDLIRRLENLEGALKTTPGGNGDYLSPGIPTPSSGKAAEEDLTSSAIKQVTDVWPDFLETLGKNRPILKTYLHEGAPLKLEKGVLTVCFGEEFDFHREALESPANIAYLENLIKNKLGFPVKLEFVIAPENSSGSCREGAEGIPSSPTKKKLVKQNPLIRTAIDLFDGTIVDIKE